MTSEQRYPGLFVVFEGGDSVGKSTQVRYLRASLEQENVPHVITFEPGDTWLGAHMRHLVLSPESGDIRAKTEALLYIADKAQHVAELVIPALQEGKVVVSDRYVDSTIAYQGNGRQLCADEVERVARWATDDLRPDLTVVLDADPAQAVETIESKDRLESAGLELHARARQAFLDIAAADSERYLVLNAFAPREQIAASVRDRLATLGLQLPAPVTR
ncbi:MAG: dTMP kinase [Propionibacteriaceae bacterium]|jgi:dTMP kinase|nr:dTMP kinase [Propionibacteriaceae bacterium]